MSISSRNLSEGSTLDMNDIVSIKVKFKNDETKIYKGSGLNVFKREFLKHNNQTINTKSRSAGGSYTVSNFQYEVETEGNVFENAKKMQAASGTHFDT